MRTRAECSIIRMENWMAIGITLEEGSKLCIAVINRRTINAQTKFDLNTSSLI